MKHLVVLLLLLAFGGIPTKSCARRELHEGDLKSTQLGRRGGKDELAEKSIDLGGKTIEGQRTSSAISAEISGKVSQNLGVGHAASGAGNNLNTNPGSAGSGNSNNGNNIYVNPNYQQKNGHDNIANSLSKTPSWPEPPIIIDINPCHYVDPKVSGSHC